MLLPPIPILPILSAILSSNDKEFARLLCDRDKGALAEFQELYCDELYFIASKFNNRGIPEDAWEYRTKKGYTIHVSDDVSDTYLWLVKITRNKSCHYRGDKGATFSTYIKSALNSEYTFKDWLKWKTGVTGYIPKCVDVLGNLHKDVYKLLRQTKPEDEICRKLGIELSDYHEVYLDIESALIHSNQLDLLNKPKFISIDLSDEEGSPGIELSGSEHLDPQEQLDFDIIKDILEHVISRLAAEERRLLQLYWGAKLSVDKIFSVFSEKFKKYLNELELRQSQDIYRRVDLIVDKCMKEAEQDFPDEVADYNIDKNIMKTLLRRFLHDFEVASEKTTL